jgi:uncharacterized protein (DUF736 family)
MSEKKSIGALWAHVSNGGKKYLSGSIEIDGKKVNIVVFDNAYKKEDKHPDFTIFLSEKRSESL